jgi:hypothetical protein
LFKGYLPWIYINDTDIIPANGWWNSVPALDNGEMMWGIYAVYHVLDKSANVHRAANNMEMYTKLSDLANRYKAWWDLMAKVRTFEYLFSEEFLRKIFPKKNFLPVHAVLYMRDR